jgi:two-component system sensor histidine kinase DesK
MPETRWLPARTYGVFPYVWLVYAAAVPVGLRLNRAPAPVWAYQLAILAAFLVLYLRFFGKGERASLVLAAIFWVFGAVAAPAEPSASTYFIFGATFIPWAIAGPPAYRLLFGYTLLVGLDTWLTHVSPYAAVSATVLSLVVGLACIAAAEGKRANARLRLAHDEIERLAKLAERERIARDLHDVLGHTLTLITLKSELAAKLADRDTARAASEIRDVERIARESLSELRAAVAGYRAAGIDAELAHAREVFASAGLRVECQADPVRLAPSQESVLALAIREAVTNVVRHARASAVRLRLAATADGCRFEIVDDGGGGSPVDGTGLRGMRERVEALGGTLERSIDHGTRLVVTLPGLATP